MTDTQTPQRSPLQTLAAPAAAIVFLLLAVAWLAGAFDNKIEPGLNDASTPAPADLYPVTLSQQPVYEAVPASVEAKQATLISSRIMARIDAISVRAGDRVKQGDLLIALEQSDLQSKVRQAQEQIKAIKARLTEARQNLTRAEQLQAQGLLAAADLDRARANADALSAELSGAEQGLKEAQTALTYAQIRAPIDGLVVDRFAEPGDTATPGTRLLSIYNPNSLRVEAQVREQLALALTPEQALTVELPSLNKTLEARLEERVPAADPGSRSFLIKARLTDASQLQPGMYARLQVPAGHADTLMIPRTYLVQFGQLDLVWVWADGQAYRRFVKPGRVEGDTIEILAGLAAGDQLMPPPQTGH